MANKFRFTSERTAYLRLPLCPCGWRAIRATHQSYMPMLYLHRGKVLVSLFQKRPGAGRRPARQRSRRHIKTVRLCSDYTVVKFCPRFFKSGWGSGQRPEKPYILQGGALRSEQLARLTKAVCPCSNYTVVSLGRAFSSSRLRDGGSRVPEPQAVRRGALPAGGIPRRRHPPPEAITHPS